MTNKKINKIPAFKSVEEEAKFWDTHDTTDFESEFHSADLKFVRPQPLSVRFDKQTLSKLREYANRKGIGPTTLVRMWVLERLQKPNGKFSVAR